jgi:hypothetical protein
MRSAIFIVAEKEAFQEHAKQRECRRHLIMVTWHTVETVERAEPGASYAAGTVVVTAV